MQKIALITGASGGIGSAIAKKFSENGFALALQAYRHPDRVLKTAKAFPGECPYLVLSCDLTKSDDRKRMIDELHQKLGKPSVLVNCAGVALPQMLYSETTEADYDFVFDGNVKSTMLLTKQLLEDLREKKGAIVNISSMWGLIGGSCEVIYSASKAALIGFTKSLAKELAPSGVTVNCVAPGMIPTEMNAHLTPEELEAFRSETPLEKLGSPEDVACAVWYLANAPFVTGQILSVDGGMVI